MPRPPIPIGQINRRIPEAGRIRTGELGQERTSRSGKKYRDPVAISDFIFTSAERNNVEAIASHLGGEVRPYESQGNKSPDRWMVRPGVSEIAVALPPDPLGGTPIYEQYGGGGATHRCDGITCTKYRKGPDGAPEPYEVECECAAAGVLACNVTTHLSVLLQGVRMTGVWRLTTKSHNAAVELPGMVEMVQSLQDRGIVRAVLGLKPHRQVLAGVTREFLVPVLGVDATLEELAAGQASVAALPAPAPAAETPVAIGQGAMPDAEMQHDFAAEVAAEQGLVDDEIVDAEIVEDSTENAGTDARDAAPDTGAAGGHPAASGASTDLEDLADLMDDRGLGRNTVRKVYNEHARRLGQPTAARFDDIAPGPVLDAAYAEMAGDEPDPPTSGGAPAPQADEPSDGDPPSPSGGEPASREQTQQALIMRIQKGVKSSRERQDAARHALVAYVTEGRTESSREASKSELLHAHRVLDACERGEMELHLRATGEYVVRRVRGAAA